MPERTSIDELRDEYVICRTLGHSWDDFPNAESNSEWASYATAWLALRCTRCHTERFDYIGKDMEVAYRTYTYPDKYKGIPGEGTRPNLRGELLKRSILIHSFNTNGKSSRTRRKR